MMLDDFDQIVFARRALKCTLVQILAFPLDPSEPHRRAAFAARRMYDFIHIRTLLNL
jgi:hypothetical protein